MDRSDVALIGRKGEAERLDAALARVRRGGSAVIVIAGEAGIGKSRLARELRRRAESAEMIVLHGRAHVDAVELAYAPIHEAYGRLLRGLGERSRAKLVGGLSDLARLFGDLALGGAGKLPAPIADPALERTRLFDAVALLTERLASDSPLAFVVDDLQWADSASIGVLAHLTRAAIPRVLVVATVRGSVEKVEGPAAALLSQWRREEVEEIMLPRLDDDDVRALIAARLGGAMVGDIEGRVCARAAGVPLFAEQLVFALVDSRSIVDTGRATSGKARWIAATGGGDALPPAVRDLVGQRLARLGARERAVVDALAVAGDQAEHDAIAKAASLSERDVIEALAMLRAHGFVVDGEGGSTLNHPLVAEVALALLLPATRRRMHLAFAESQQDLDALARHLRGAGRDADPGRTFDVLLAAGTRALERHANDQAVGHLAGAVALARAGTGSDRLGEVLERLGEAWHRTGQAAASVDAWREAATLLPLGRRAALFRRIAVTELDRGRGEAARSALAAAREGLAEAPEDAAERSALLHARLQIAERANDRDELRAVAAELAGTPMALVARARVALAEHRFADAWHACEQLESAAASRGDMAVLRAAEIAALVAVERWRPNEAIPRAETVERLGRALGEPASQLRGVGLHAAAVLHAGRIEDATRLATAARELARRWDIARGLVRTNMMLGCIAVVRGRDAEAASLLAVSIEANVKTTGDHWNTSLIALLAALMAIDGDGRVDITPHLSALADEGGDQWLFRRLLAGELAVRDGRLDDALALTADETVTEWIRAHVDRARGDIDRAIERMQRVVRDIDADLFRIRAYVLLAHLADGDAAIAAAREASAIADRTGMTRYGDRARQRLRDLGVRPSTRRGASGGELSARELEVARAYAEGLSSAEVGRRLSISAHTAATHLQKIYRRLGVSSRAELTRWLIDRE